MKALHMFFYCALEDRPRKAFCIHVSYPYRPKSLRRCQFLWKDGLRKIQKRYKNQNFIQLFYILLHFIFIILISVLHVPVFVFSSFVFNFYFSSPLFFSLFFLLLFLVLFYSSLFQRPKLQVLLLQLRRFIPHLKLFSYTLIFLWGSLFFIF